MSEIQAWRFLVSRNQFLDYRTVVVPDFMCQANIASLLAKAAEGDYTTGVCALVEPEQGSTQIAVFRFGEGTDVFALSNYDPFSKAYVLSRGLVGDRKGTPKVASPSQ